MMETNVRKSLSTGVVFGIVLIFLFLIGFTGIAAELIGQILQLDAIAAGLGAGGGTLDLIIFLGIMGVWTGASAGRDLARDPASRKWVPAVAALGGFTSGLMLAVVVYFVGTLNAAGVKLTTYLPQLLPQAILQILYGLSPLPAALVHCVFMAIMGGIGGLLAAAAERGSWGAAIAAFWKRWWSAVAHLRIVEQVMAGPLGRLGVYGPIVLVVAVLPLVLGPYWNNVVGTVGIYLVLGLGLNIVVGLAGLLDLGYVAFFAIGAYATALLTAPQPHHLMWSFWVTVPIGIILAATAGILLGIPVLRMRGDYLAIVTLGFGQIIGVLLKSDVLTSFTGGPKGVSAVGGPSFFGKSFTSDVDFVYLILLAALLIIFVTNRLQHSRIGRAWEAMREDESVARAMGINLMTTKLMAFAFGAAFAGLGGVLFAARNQFTGPEDHNLMVSINVLSELIVGGMGSIPGAVAGAFALKGLPEVLRELQDYRVLAFGALLVVMMIWRPAGFFPSSRRKLDIQPGETSAGSASEPGTGGSPP
jgi:ABC-type branched-subunit amino acid transport system permease subunit